MRLKYLLVGLLISLYLPLNANAAIQDEFYKGYITKVQEEANAIGRYQIIGAEIANGPDKSKTVTIEYGKNFTLNKENKLKIGDKIIINKNGEDYFVVDINRSPPLIFISLIFLFSAIFFGRIKGLTAILGMFFSVIILVSFVIPSILAGSDPLLTSLFATFIIAFISLYLAHGFNKTTTIALVSTLLTLTLAAILSILFVSIMKLYGFGSEEVMYLQLGSFANLNFKGLLLGGIILGALGVLDDITIGQVSIVSELKSVNPNLTFKELYKRATSVGREHIASLVNTLFLAYAGASFPALMVFMADSTIPLWVTLNSEFIGEEIVRTLVGSTALIFAVPISTFLAAWFFSKNSIQKSKHIKTHQHL